MNKVTLAKMLGLEVEDYSSVNKWEIKELLEHDWNYIEWKFLDGKIEVSVVQEDFTEDKLDIKPEDLIEDGDIKVCIKQVEDLLWERAADDYLKRIHNAAMMIGG